MEAMFTIIGGPDAGRTFVLRDEAVLTLGRSSQSGLQLLAEGVSRNHCSLEMTSGVLRVTDLGSHNGTWVNDRKVASAVINPGDRLRVGPNVLEVRVVDRPSAFSGTIATVDTRGEDAGTLKHALVDTSDIAILTAGPRPADTVDDVSHLARSLQDLCKVGMALNSELELKGLLKTVIEVALRTVRAERAAILLYHPQSGTYEQVAGGRWGDPNALEVDVSFTVVGEVVQRGASVLTADAGIDPRFRSGDSIQDLGIRSVMCVPLRKGRTILGALYVDNSDPGRVFKAFDLDILSAIGAQAGVAIERARLIEGLEELFLGSIRALVASIEARDPYTRGHSERVTAFALAIADELGLDPEERETVELAGLLHDVGKIGVAEAILNKQGKLTDDEYEVIKRHPAQGEEIVRHVPHRNLPPVLAAVRQHHERWDGKGYPDGLAGDAILRPARILAVADTWDAMTSDRPYRKGFPDERALSILREVKGTQLDETMVAAFLVAWRKGIVAQAARLEGPALTSRYLRSPTGPGGDLLKVTLTHS